MIISNSTKFIWLLILNTINTVLSSRSDRLMNTFKVYLEDLIVFNNQTWYSKFRSRIVKLSRMCLELNLLEVLESLIMWKRRSSKTRFKKKKVYKVLKTNKRRMMKTFHPMVSSSSSRKKLPRRKLILRKQFLFLIRSKEKNSLLLLEKNWLQKIKLTSKIRRHTKIMDLQ